MVEHLPIILFTLFAVTVVYCAYKIATSQATITIQPTVTIMGARENKVEDYLDKRVTDLNGITRKWVSPGRDGVPDRIVIIDRVVFVEVKTDDGVLEAWQSREHARLRVAGATVTTVYGVRGVDEFIADIVTLGFIRQEYR